MDKHENERNPFDGEIATISPRITSFAKGDGGPFPPHRWSEI